MIGTISAIMRKSMGDGKFPFDLDNFRWALSHSYPIVTGIDVEDGFNDVTGELAYTQRLTERQKDMLLQSLVMTTTLMAVPSSF